MNLERLKTELTRDEGRKPKLYADSVGKLTIGVGHNLSDKPLIAKAIDVILEDDIGDAENDLDRALPWWKTLDEVRQRVLANMCFNLGIESLCGFKNTLRAVQEGRYSDAARLMLESKWAAQVGVRAERLSKMMETGNELA